MSFTYQKPEPGRSLTDTVMSNWRTPKVKVKFSNLVNAFYYPNAPQVPRYSVTVLVHSKEHEQFLDQMLAIENNEKVPTIFKQELEKMDGQTVQTGNSILKFNCKKDTPIIRVSKDGKQLPSGQLKEELPAGAEVEVVFDLIRYFSKTTNEKGISCRASLIYWHEATKHTAQNKNALEDEECPF